MSDIIWEQDSSIQQVSCLGVADSKRKPHARDRGDCARQSVEKAKHSRVSEEAKKMLRLDFLCLQSVSGSV